MALAVRNDSDLVYGYPQVEQQKLSERVLSVVMDNHRKTLANDFFSGLKNGKISDFEYNQYLTDQLALYEVFDDLKPWIAQDPRFNDVYFEKIGRTNKLMEDLGHEKFKGINNKPSEVVLEFVNYLKGLNPVRFFAQAYVKYVGDLAGASGLKAYVNGKWPIAVYDFSELIQEYKVESSFKFKDIFYKNRFDSIKLSESEIQEFLAETILAFDWVEKVTNAAVTPQIPEITLEESQQNLKFLAYKV